MLEAAESEERARTTGALGRAVQAVSGVTLLSRVGGLVRDVLIGRIFGDTPIGSAFAAAFAIPNMFRRLFGEGALSAAFIPAYTRALPVSPEAHPPGQPTGADRLASLTLAVLGLVTGGLTLAIAAVLLVLLAVLPSSPERDLSLRLILVMIPFMPLICCAAILAGMLQVHGRFGPSSTGPLVLNGFIIAVGLWCLWSGTLAGEGVAYALGVATVLSALTQLIWFLRLLRPHARWTRRWDDAREPARRMLRAFVPVAIGLGTMQLNAFVDMLIAMYPIWIGPTLLGAAYPLDGASNIILALTQRLYQFPLGVFGLAVATAIFPLLSRQSGEPAEFGATLRAGLRLSLFIGLPASAGLVLVRHDLCAVLFGHGSHGFSDEGVMRSADVLMGFAPGVWAYALNHVLTRGFYARGDTLTPMKVACAMVGVNFLLNVTLIWWLREAGLAWGTSLSAVLQCAVLAWLLRRALPAEARAVDGGAADRRGVVRVVLLTGAMALLCTLFRWSWEVVEAWTVYGELSRLLGAWGAALLRVGAVTAIGVAVYIGGARRLGCEELRWLLARGRAD
jgi:putative peptidoglycan lipid II flippase